MTNPLASSVATSGEQLSPSDSIYGSRIAKLRASLTASNCDSAVVSHLPNIRYLTGFTGSAGFFFLGPETEHLVVDFRYVEQAAQQCRCKITKREGPLEKQLAAFLLGGRRCAVEANHMTLTAMDKFRSGGSDGTPIEWIPRSGLVESIRIVKDESEIDRLRAAAALLEDLMGRTLEFIRPGITELDAALHFELLARRATGRPLPFEPIVASGSRGALPHGIASKKVIEKGELVVVDIGLDLDGYVADMTRTVAVQSADDRQREIHEAVHLANRTAAKGIRPGISGQEAHMIALGVLDSRELGKYFGHGLGHGIGVEIHEDPRLAPLSEEKLLPGMVFTIEPGVYIPGWGGVRIEDAGVLRDDGVDIFNRMERSLVVV
ncbi:MAG: Xaa-Pro peptidase family protein [Candidatus Hydrogenedentota bacterium]